MRALVLGFSLVFVPSVSWAKNELPAKRPFRNHYVGMRHGESFSNLEKRVCSSMKAGITPENGLTDKGKAQAKENARKWVESNSDLLTKAIQDRRIRIVASPFSRTQDTAKILAQVIEESFRAKSGGEGYSIPIQTNPDLRERFFGDYEGKSTPAGFWEAMNQKDEADPNQTEGNVEKVTAMETRVTKVLKGLERENKNGGKRELVFIVSHSDPLSALQNAIEKRPVNQYIHIQRFKTAEIRDFEGVSTGKH